jgi:hypothetical protein
MRVAPGLAGFLMSRDRAAKEDEQSFKEQTTLQGILERRKANEMASADRQMAIADRAEGRRHANDLALQKLDYTAQFEDLKHQARMGQLQNANERAAELARHNQAMEEIGKLRAQNAATQQERSGYSTVLNTDSGMFSFDNRTRAVAPIEHGGRQLVRSTDSPALQGRIAGAKEGGQARAKREFNMEGIGGVIKKAEDTLNGKQAPTASGIGTLVDRVGGWVGMSPPGASEAEQLRAIGGALVAKMPRMEGPQSDRDVQLYREMAAQVGDSNIPLPRRKAALQSVKDLWMKYETLNPEAFAPSAPAPAPASAPAAPAAQRGTSKSGKPIIFRNGRWEYE